MKTTVKIKKITGKFKLEQTEVPVKFVGLPVVELAKFEVGKTYLIRVEPDSRKDARWVVAEYSVAGGFYVSALSRSYNHVETREVLGPLPEIKR